MFKDDNQLDDFFGLKSNDESRSAERRKEGIKETVLKSKSPSCGVGRIYDGSFKGILSGGDGVTAALLRREKIICRDI